MDAVHFEPILDAMQMVIEDPSGTGRKAYTRGVTTCGKTGTVQNKNRADHSVFMAFAPRENPKIALHAWRGGEGGVVDEWQARGV